MKKTNYAMVNAQRNRHSARRGEQAQLLKKLFADPPRVSLERVNQKDYILIRTPADADSGERPYSFWIEIEDNRK